MSQKLQGSGVNYSIGRLTATMFHFSFLLAVLIIGLSAVQLQAITWITNTGTGDWSNAANWNGGTVPNAAGAAAEFTNDVPATDEVVTLDAGLPNPPSPSNATVGTLVFSDSDTSTAGGWTIAASTTNYLNLDNSGSASTITVNTLAPTKIATISAPVTVVNGLTKDGIGALTLSGAVSLSAGNINVSAGTLTLSAANTMTSSNTVNLSSSGTLNLNLAGALGSTGAVLTINGGTLDNTSGLAKTVSTASQNWNGDFTFAGSNNLILGGAVTLGGNRQVTVNGTGILQISGAVGGTGYSLTKTGAGNLTLSAAATYTGGTFINGGTLTMGSNATPFPSGSSITFNNGGTLSITASGTPNFQYPIVMTGSGTYNVRASAYINPSTITGSGTLNLSESGTSAFTASLCGTAWTSYTGAINFVNSTTTPSSTMATFRLFTNASGNPAVFSGFNALSPISLGSYVTISTKTASGVNTFNMGSLSGDSTTWIDGGSSGGAALYSIGGSNADSTFAGNFFDGTGLMLTKVGNGTLTLTGTNNNSTGAISINNGTLKIGSGGTTGLLGTGAITNTSPAPYVGLVFNRTDALDVPNAISGSGSIAVNSGTVYFNNNAAYVANAVEVKNLATVGGQGRITQTVTVDSGAKLENGEGASGSLTVGSLNFLGTAEHSADVNFTTSSGVLSTLTVLNSGTNVVTNGVHSVYINILGTPVNNGTYDLINYGGTAGGTITDYNAFKLGNTPTSGIRTKTYTLQNHANEIDLFVAGTDNNTTWTGASGDGIWDNVTTRSPNKNWVFNAGGQTDFVIGDNVTFGDGGPRTVTITDSANVSPATVTFTNTTNLTITGANGIANGAILHKTSGAGTVYIQTSNSFTGNTTINAGTISIAADGASGGNSAPLGAVPLAATPGNVVLNGGALNSSATITLNANRGVALGPTSGSGSGTIDVDDSQEFTVAGVIANNGSGTGNLNKTGSGDLTLLATNTFTGTTTISGGVLRLGSSTGTANYSILPNSTLNYNGGGTLKFGSLLTGSHTLGNTSSGASTSVAVLLGGLSGTQNLTLSNDSGAGVFLGVGNNNADSTYSGSLSGTGGTLVKVGSGTFTLSGGIHSYTGNTYINRGNLVVSGSAQLTPGTEMHVGCFGDANGGTGAAENLTFTDTAQGSFSLLEIGGNTRNYGNVTIQGSASLTVSGTFDLNNEYTGSGTASNNQVNLNGGTLTVGSFTKTIPYSGSDTNKLATINFNGGTLMGYGTILPALGGVTAIVQTGGAKIDTAGNTIQINQPLTGAAGGDGGLHLINSSILPGTLILTGNNTYAGTTTIDALGTLQVGDNGATVGGTGTMGTGPVNNSGKIYLYRTGTYTLPNAIGGTGSLEQAISGSTAILTSPNTYSGPTTISAGTLILTGTQLTSGVSVGGYGAYFGAGTGGTTIPSLTLADSSTLVPSDGTSLTTITVTTPVAPGAGIINNGNTYIAPGNLGAQVYTGGGALPVLRVLVSYTGTQINGGYTLTVPARVTATLDYSHTGAIDMNVTAVKYPRWNGTHDNGSGGRDWNFATQNWTEYSTGAATTYQEPVGEPDFVYFDDNATGLTTVNIPAFTTVYPGQVNVNNNAKNYTFTGPGYISGTTALIKTGTGMLTITNNGGNNYTGGTKISEGTLSFATGVLPATGAIIMDGGTLQWNGVNSDDVSNRLIVNSGKTAILDTNNNAVTLASPLSFGSTSALTKVGLGTMTLTGSSTFTGDVNVNGGTLTANLSNNQPSPGLGLSALGNPIVAHNVNINSGGTLNFASSYTLGSPGTTPLLTLVINSLGTVTNTAGTFNPLGPVQLNGGSLTTNAGVDVNHQAFFLKGTVTVGGSSPSTISGSGSFSGIQMSAPTTFNVANVTLDSSTDLTVSTDLTDESASGTPPYPAASLTKTGAGTMTVTVNTTYTGNTYVNGGVLNMLNLNVPNSTVSVNNSGSTLNVQSLNTGTLTIGAGTTVVIKAITGGPSAGGSISPVPEPATWVMLLLAAMGLGIYRRRSR